MKKFSISLEQEQYDQLVLVASKYDTNAAALARKLIVDGLSTNVLEDQASLITGIVRMAMDQAMKPGIERLAAISAKAAMSSATATFLNLHVLHKVGHMAEDDIMELHNDARREAHEYVRKSVKGNSFEED